MLNDNLVSPIVLQDAKQGPLCRTQHPPESVLDSSDIIPVFMR